VDPTHSNRVRTVITVTQSNPYTQASMESLCAAIAKRTSNTLAVQLSDLIVVRRPQSLFSQLKNRHTQNGFTFGCLSENLEPGDHNHLTQPNPIKYCQGIQQRSTVAWVHNAHYSEATSIGRDWYGRNSDVDMLPQLLSCDMTSLPVDPALNRAAASATSDL